MPDRTLLFVLLTSLFAAACSHTPDYYIPPAIIPNRAELLAATPPPNPDWTPAEMALLRDLWLGSLPPLPADPTNGVADNPQAAALGHKLFFDTRLSANNQIACATCHRPDLFFTDGFARSFGTRTTRRNAPTIAGAAYSPWLLWDGHKDSLWAQALEPVEHPDEQGATRLQAMHLIRQDETYRPLYEAAFGPLPSELADFSRFPDSGGPVAYEPYRANWESMQPVDQAVVTQIYVNLGKALAAYERLILPGPTRFDAYVKAVWQGDAEAADVALTAEERAGLRLFIGPGGCVRCHSGPLLTDGQFHNTGIPPAESLPPDQGRAEGVRRLLADHFNCLSSYSDASQKDCSALRALREDDASALYRFKTPTLRNVAETAPYMHAGQLETLRAVLLHYNQAPAAPLGQSDLQPLNLSEAELGQLEAFLRSLSGALASPPPLLGPPDD